MAVEQAERRAKQRLSIAAERFRSWEISESRKKEISEEPREFLSINLTGWGGGPGGGQEDNKVPGTNDL